MKVAPPSDGYWRERMRLAVLVLLGLLGPLVARPAFAQCPVELVPSDAPGSWGIAARAAERRLATASSHDCGSVEIAVRPSGGALLTFITTDGRRAVRALMSADEIGPALDALLVMLPPVEPTPRPSASTTPEAEVTPPETKPTKPTQPTQPTQPTPAAQRPEVHFILGAAAGIRLGLGGAYLAPSFVGRPSGTFGPWEIAGRVEWNPRYAYLPGGVPPGFFLWSYKIGMQLGRRDSIGKVTFAYGLDLGVATVREEADDAADGRERAVDTSQPRAGAYGAVIVPRAGTARARFDLGFDVALDRFKKGASSRNDLPTLPRVGLLFTAGIETNAL
jgi:hypothetical protein